MLDMRREGVSKGSSAPTSLVYRYTAGTTDLSSTKKELRDMRRRAIGWPYRCCTTGDQ
jgi:hypothetical protein